MTSAGGLREVNFTEVTFESAPALNIADLPKLAELIEQRRQNNAASYGAYVIQSLDPEGKAACGSLVKRFANMGRGTATHSFRGRISGLHGDGGPTNQVTFHFEFYGSVEARLLLGSRYTSEAPIDKFYNQVRHQTTVDCAERLFDETPTIDTRLITPPLRAIKAKLNQGDGLIFDDSQLHAFKAASKTRVSIASYAQRPEPITPSEKL